MRIILDRNLVLLFAALGCAYLVSPVYAGVLAALVLAAALRLRLLALGS